MTDAQVDPLPPLVVGTDPVAIRKAFRAPLVAVPALVVITAALAATCAALMASVSGFASGVAAAIPILISTAFLAYLSVFMTKISVARASLVTVLRLDPAGMAATSADGTLVLPWQAVASVSVRKRGRHRILVYRIGAGVTPQSPGVSSTLPAAVFDALVKRGYQMGPVGIDTPVQTILDATAAFTAGRLTAA